MGKTRKAAKSKKDKKDKRGQKPNKQKPHKQSSGSSANGPCPHCPHIAQDPIRRLFANPAFLKATSGKRLTRPEFHSLAPHHPHVDWYHPTDLLICLICGQVVEQKQSQRHFNGTHNVWLSLELQMSHCTVCDSDFEVYAGSFCGDLLGVQDTEPPDSAELVDARDAPMGSVRGLVNLGNSCWLNSVVQVLVRAPNFCSRGDGEISAAFSALVEQLGARGKPFRPSAFVAAINAKLDWLSVDEQQDANEFLMLFLDQLRNEQGGTCVGLSSTDVETVRKCIETPVDRVFAFIQKTTIVCEACELESVLYEKLSVMWLSIPLGGRETTLEDCLRLYFSSFGGEDRICEHCDKPCEYRMTYSCETFPDVLAIHLTRFKFKGNRWVKNNIRVSFTHDLTLGDGQANYELLGFVSHYGTMEDGHYTSIAKIESFYFEFNDTDVHPADPNKIFALQAYLLFYRKLS
jgi:ubiquitin C-terminal hydrolase